MFITCLKSCFSILANFLGFVLKTSFLTLVIKCSFKLEFWKKVQKISYGRQIIIIFYLNKSYNPIIKLNFTIGLYYGILSLQFDFGLAIYTCCLVMCWILHWLKKSSNTDLLNVPILLCFLFILLLSYLSLFSFFLILSQSFLMFIFYTWTWNEVCNL